MKTLKELKKEITPNDVLTQISRSYVYSMGGTRKLIVDGKELLFIDNREYYSGRGKKYNGSIRHDVQFYILTVDEYEKNISEIAKSRFNSEKLKLEKLRKEKEIANNWRNEISEFISITKNIWHLGFCRVWHNVIPCQGESKYLKNQLRNWLLKDGNYKKFGFKYYENDYNYSSYYFLSTIKKLNENNPKIFAIFDAELSGLKVSEEKLKEYYR